MFNVSFALLFVMFLIYNFKFTCSQMITSVLSTTTVTKTHCYI